MAYCSRCGTALQSGAQFCAQCGTAVAAQPNAPAPAAAPLRPMNVPLVSTPLGSGCRYHPNAPVLGRCVDCQNAFCEECGIGILRHGTVCLDCGTQFARKKLKQAYIAAGLGFIAGIAIAFSAAAEHRWLFAIFAPFIYSYFFAAIFFGWHYGGKIWTHMAKATDHFSGMGGFIASLLFLSFRITVAILLGVFGGGIVQYLRYKKMIQFHDSLPGAS